MYGKPFISISAVLLYLASNNHFEEYIIDLYWEYVNDVEFEVIKFS